MKIRLIENGDTIFETRKGEITEIPEERSTIFVDGVLKYCCNVYKSYEKDQYGDPEIWFVGDVY